MPADVQTYDPIVITASRIAEERSASASSVTVLGPATIERTGLALADQLIRLTPSAAVSVSGPAGTLTDIRIRGAEANHTLLFIDGIRANDPAAGDIPRFELLNADLADRIEVLRGPQSALWGADALGGVVALSGGNATARHAMFEGGSFGFARASASAGVSGDGLAFHIGAGAQSSRGIDSFDGSGDKDGYRNRAARARVVVQPTPTLDLGLSGFVLTSRSEYDGYDPVTFVRADTRDESRNRLAAGRAWAAIGSKKTPWRMIIGASTLGSSNRNLLANSPINRTWGSRQTVDAQVEWQFSDRHMLIAAIEGDREVFRARDVAFGGFTRQDRTRDHAGLTAEWRGQFGALSTDLALRRDLYNRFRDATSVRASGLLGLGRGWSVAGSYATGMAPPTFFDLYGFFPGSFVGNPDLRPETSRGGEIALRYAKGPWSGALTGYYQTLRNEIVDIFDFATFTSTTANASGMSRRRGIEAELRWSPSPALSLATNGALLRATEPRPFASGQQVELRRPSASGAFTADGVSGRFTYGLALAFTGRHRDRRDSPPYDVVSLDPYALASLKVAYRIVPRIDAWLRLSNAFDVKARDLVGYRSEGRGIYAGVRLRP